MRKIIKLSEKCEDKISGGSPYTIVESKKHYNNEQVKTCSKDDVNKTNSQELYQICINVYVNTAR